MDSSNYYISYSYKEKFIPRNLICSEETRAVKISGSLLCLLAMYANTDTDMVELTPCNFRKEVIVIRGQCLDYQVLCTLVSES